MIDIEQLYSIANGTAERVLINAERQGGEYFRTFPLNQDQRNLVRTAVVEDDKKLRYYLSKHKLPLGGTVLTCLRRSLPVLPDSENSIILAEVVKIMLTAFDWGEKIFSYTDHHYFETMNLQTGDKHLYPGSLSIFGVPALPIDRIRDGICSSLGYDIGEVRRREIPVEALGAIFSIVRKSPLKELTQFDLAVDEFAITDLQKLPDWNNTSPLA